MSTPNETPGNPFEAATPPTKGKEKKRVGWSQGNSTPHQAQSVPGSGGAGAGPAQAERTPDEDRSSHDGVDHQELTRALSRILSDEQLERHAENSSSGEQSGAASASRPAQEPAARAPVPASAVLAEPAPPYFPPARQQQQEQSEKAARDRADRLAQSVERDYSNPASRAASEDGGSDDEDEAAATEETLFGLRRRRWRSGTISRSNRGRGDNDEADDSREGGGEGDDDEQRPQLDPHTAALNLVQSHARGNVPRAAILSQQTTDDSGFHYDAAMAHSGYSTPTNTFEQNDGREYIPPPNKYNGGVLSSLLRLYNNPNASASNSAVNSEHSTPTGTPTSSRPPSPGAGDGTETPKRRSGFFGKKAGKSHEHDGTSTPKTKGQPWGVFHPNHKHSHSTTSLTAGLLGTSSILASAGSAGIGQAVTEKVKRERPPLKRNRHSASSIFGAGSPKLREGGGSGGSGGGRRRRREEEQMRITKHIAEVLSRHRYLTTLCRALMMYGAPTHRLEDYLKMSARVLEIEAQFLYIPGCMLVSFDDSSTHTAEVKLVRAPQGVDLGKLSDVHVIYKEVIHDLISVDEAISRLNGITSKPPKFKVWMRIPVYGLASACVAPFAFGGRFIDIPMCFVLGCIVGILALIAAPSNAIYSNVFEITAAVITSFLARAIGSIAGGNIFCFSALAQSSIALILPGYMVLCSSLELQSQNIVAGSVRMVYAMIYTLFLGYGITIGTAVYGAIDSNANSTTNCSNSLTRPWYFLFVPFFTICLCIINQAKWRQMPMMVLISVGGFAVNTYASSYFSSNAQIPNSLGALCVGILANLYARTSPYFERFFAPIRVKYIDPFSSAVNRRKNRLSRRGGGRSKDANGNYFDMPPYRKTDDETNRAEEGTNSSITKTNSNNDQRTAAEIDAATAKAEKKAPGSTEVIGYGLAAAAMLPAIFVQVPSGLAVNGSLLSGINAANELTGNSSTPAGSGNSSDSSSINNVSFTVLLSVIQVAIGITVGLFFAAIIVYPLGKRRSALFSF